MTMSYRGRTLPVLKWICISLIIGFILYDMNGNHRRLLNEQRLIWNSASDSRLD